MEDVRQDVRRLTMAVFGDPDNHRERPGIIHELSHLEECMDRANESLHQISNDIRKVVWAIIFAIISAIVAMLIK